MKNFDKLLQVATRLRSRTGCPWDRKQTIQSLAPCIAEEGEEVQEAIKKKDWRNLEEELGDLMFNIILTTQIANEKKLFSMAGVLKKVEKKIIARHSWVFGPDRKKVKTAADALKLWKKNKKKN